MMHLKTYHRLFIILGIALTMIPNQAASRPLLGQSLCENPNYVCQKIEKGETWKSIFIDLEQRNLVKRLNRMNVPLQVGDIIAIPKQQDATPFDISPFPKKIESSEEKKLIVDLAQLAWGAYDADGNLLKWGPVSGGKSWCPDSQRKCHTPDGTFSILWKGGAKCKSSSYPLPDGGAPMPYCMFFRAYYAIHGSDTVPGYHASHGCVRIFPEDAEWLNQEFIETPDKETHTPGTTVIIQPYKN